MADETIEKTKEMHKKDNRYLQTIVFFVAGLNDAGLKCLMPHGAFYAFPSVKETGMSSEEFAEKLLKEERVAVVPGTAFGPGGEGFVRCCYATGAAELREALVRIKRFMGR